MNFELFIAARYLRAKRRQAVISVITAISVVGVTAGVASLIIALAINNGFRQDLQQRLLGSTSHVSLMRTAQDDGFRNYPAMMERLSKEPHVVAVSPAIYEEVLLSRGARAKGVILKGIIPEKEEQVSGLLKNVTIGSAAALKEDKTLQPLEGSKSELPAPALAPIVLGRELATGIGANVGSVVLVTSPQGELTPFGMVPKYVRFKVVGIFASGFYDYDSAWAFIRLSDSQRLFGLGDIISILEFKLDDLYQAEAVGKRLEAAAGPGFQSENWMEKNQALFRALRLEKVVTFITIGLIVMVAALNILISLIMMVMEKNKDIAVLMSMGARRGQIRRIFIMQGMLIGVIGTFFGLILGYAISWAGAHYKLIALSAEVYSIDYVPFAPRLIDGVIVAGVAIAISFISTIYPSWSAAKILPAEALRYE